MRVNMSVIRERKYDQWCTRVYWSSPFVKHGPKLMWVLVTKLQVLCLKNFWKSGCEVRFQEKEKEKRESH